MPKIEYIPQLQDIPPETPYFAAPVAPIEEEDEDEELECQPCNAWPVVGKVSNSVESLMGVGKVNKGVTGKRGQQWV